MKTLPIPFPQTFQMFSSELDLARKFSVAPMMEVTDRHFRFFLRILSQKALLYTEMITCNSLLKGNPERFLLFDSMEKPLVIQLAGCNPKDFEKCASLCESYGYDEINLNIGCPSSKATSGNFGAVLMKDPNLVAECVDAIYKKTKLPVSIKSRIGVDEQDSFEELCSFVEKVGKAGCRIWIIHARKALLSGVSPKKNRTIPKVDYVCVQNLKSQFPNFHFTLNGEIKSLEQIETLLEKFDGVMLGREIRDNPFLMAQVDSTIFKANPKEITISKSKALQTYLPYLEKNVAEGVPLRKILGHLQKLFQGKKGAKQWRIRMTNPQIEPNRVADFLQESVAICSHLEKAG